MPPGRFKRSNQHGVSTHSSQAAYICYRSPLWTGRDVSPLDHSSWLCSYPSCLAQFSYQEHLAALSVTALRGRRMGWKLAGFGVFVSRRVGYRTIFTYMHCVSRVPWQTRYIALPNTVRAPSDVVMITTGFP